MRARATVVAVLGLGLCVVGLAGCTSETSSPLPSPSPDASPTPGASDGPSPSASGSPSATASTAPASATATPGTDPMAWQAVPGPVTDAVTVAGPWTLTVPEDGSVARLTGPASVSVRAGSRGRITETFLDDRFALVVSQDRLEERPAVATVVELASGRRWVLDGRSSPPTTTGGTWAMGGGHVYHASYVDEAYCLAAVDLAAGSSEVAWCAPDRHGFSNARVGADGVLSLLTFDDSQPSCRTVVTLVDGAQAAYPGVPACKGWEGVTLTGGRAWTVVPRENRIEQAHAYAADGDTVVDLGEATSGSLLACGDAAYFTRDPGREGEPARVLRWRPGDGLTVVYEAPAGKDGFVTVPLRCGGDRLTLTALTDGGDQQVSAPLG